MLTAAVIGPTGSVTSWSLLLAAVIALTAGVISSIQLRVWTSGFGMPL